MGSTVNKNVANRLLNNALYVQTIADRIHDEPTANLQTSLEELKKLTRGMYLLRIEGPGSGTVEYSLGKIDNTVRRLWAENFRGVVRDNVTAAAAAELRKAANTLAKLAIRELEAPVTIVQPIDPGSGIG